VNRTSRAEAVVLAVTDLLLVVGALAAAYALRFWFEVGAVNAAPPADRYEEALLVVLVITHLVLRGLGRYEVLPPRGFDVFEDTLRAVSAATVVVLAASFFYREVTYSRSVVLIAWSFEVVLLPIPRLLLLYRRRARYESGEGLVPVLIVARTAPRAAELLARLADHRRFGLQVVGFATSDAAPVAAEGVAWLGRLDALPRHLAASRAREVLVADDLERLELLELLEVCERAGVEARVVPCIYDLFTTARDLTELHGVAFIAVRERRFELVSHAVKRAFDAVVGAALLLVALPVIAVLCLLIRRDSPGRALFGQRRIGEGGRPFTMWKLRSMVQDAEARLKDVVDLDALAAPVFKLEKDPRVTRVGRWLRRTSLDELPQLWNIVKGEMSLVGPRPEAENVVARYDAHHRRRLKAKPGLTGLQQVVARGSTNLDERVRLDVYYIRRRTLLYDVWILLRTPWAAVRGHGAV
jgi:exopolysaccharide biosynthesis polyprenyl glycosylphosphotransferase